MPGLNFKNMKVTFQILDTLYNTYSFTELVYRGNILFNPGLLFQFRITGERKYNPA